MTPVAGKAQPNTLVRFKFACYGKYIAASLSDPAIRRRLEGKIWTSVDGLGPSEDDLFALDADTESHLARQ